MEKSILKFWAVGCVNCKAMESIVNQLKAEHKDITFTDHNTKESDDLVAKYEVSGLPTLVFLKNGEMVAKMSGLKPKSLVEKKIAEVF